MQRRVRHAGERGVERDERRPARRHRHGRDARGRNGVRATREGGGCRRRQREGDGGEFRVREAAVVEQCPAAATALEAHDPGAVLDVEILGEEARQRVHRRHADPQVARLLAIRPVRLPATRGAGGCRSLQHPGESGVRRGQVLRAVVEARRRESPRREAPARRALRLEHARMHAGLGEAPRAGESRQARRRSRRPRRHSC